MILDLDHLRIIMAPVRVIDTGIIKELFHCDTNVPTPEGRAHMNSTRPSQPISKASSKPCCRTCMKDCTVRLIVHPRVTQKKLPFLLISHPRVTGKKLPQPSRKHQRKLKHRPSSSRMEVFKLFLQGLVLP